jgi:prolyl oligopeptidase
LAQIVYPETRKGNDTILIHDTIIKDPFRWLENGSDTTVQKWVDEQNNTSLNYFSKITCYDKIRKNITDKSGYFIPGKNELKKKEIELGIAFDEDYKTNPLSFSPKLFYRTKYEPWRVLINPAKFRKSSEEIVEITEYIPSSDNKYLLFLLRRNGTDWKEIRIMDMTNQKVLPDLIENVKYGNPIWYEDGFFFFKQQKQKNQLLDKDESPRLYYHRLRSNHANDTEIPIEAISGAGILDKNQLLTISGKQINNREFTLYNRTIFDSNFSSDSLKSNTFLLFPSKNRYKVNLIYTGRDSSIILNNLHANKGNIMKYSLNELNRFDTLVPEFDEVLCDAFYFKGNLNGLYYKNFAYTLVKFGANNKPLKTLTFPRFSEVSFETDNGHLFYTLYSIDKPPINYQISYEDLKPYLVNKTEVHYDALNLQYRYIECISKNGVKIPILLIYKKGLKINGNQPVLLESYGGFGLIKNPTFSLGNVIWLKNNGIIAIASIRGGGEKGRDWHFSAIRTNKQKSINDFIETAQFLIDSGFAHPKKLFATGASNGGLIVISASIQSPDLFAGVVSNVGIYDMLRFERFTVGQNFTDEYGSVSDSADFRALLSYSPLHNISGNKNYPPTLILTGDHDDRVPPLHSYKLAATLQNNLSQTHPVLLFTARNSGHNTNESGKNLYQSEAIKWAFLFSILNMEPKLLD